MFFVLLCLLQSRLRSYPIQYWIGDQPRARNCETKCNEPRIIPLHLLRSFWSTSDWYRANVWTKKDAACNWLMVVVHLSPVCDYQQIMHCAWFISRRELCSVVWVGCLFICNIPQDTIHTFALVGGRSRIGNIISGVPFVFGMEVLASPLESHAQPSV